MPFYDKLYQSIRRSPGDEGKGLSGYADLCARGNCPVEKPDAGGLTVGFGLGPFGIAFSGIQTEKGNQFFISGSYTAGVAGVKSPFVISFDTYYRTEHAKKEVPTDNYIKGTSSSNSFFVYTRTTVNDNNGLTTLKGHSFGITGLGFGIIQTK